MKSRILAFVLMLLATPVLAQTDDRISNDALQLLAADAVITEIGTMCIADTADPLMAEAMAGWRARNQSWRIVAATTLGARGAYFTEEAFALAQKGVRDGMLPNYEAAADKAEWCLRMARDIETGQLTAGVLYPDSAQRIEEARLGKWPVLDIEASIEVWSAGLIKKRFAEVEHMMSRCATEFGDPRGLFADAYPYWRTRNLEALRYAETVLQAWGALAPARAIAADERGALAVDILFYDEQQARSRCELFISQVEDGGEDIAVTDAALFGNIQRYAENPPGPE